MTDIFLEIFFHLCLNVKTLVLSLAGIMKGCRFINGKEWLNGVFFAVESEKPAIHLTCLLNSAMHHEKLSLQISEILKRYLVFVAVSVGRESFIPQETFRLPISPRKSIFKVQLCRLCDQLEGSKSHTHVLSKAVFSSHNLFIFNNRQRK